jgi:hypothetical protein
MRRCRSSWRPSPMRWRAGHHWQCKAKIYVSTAPPTSLSWFSVASRCSWLLKILGWVIQVFYYSGFQKMILKISNIRHFEHLKIQVRLLSNMFYLITMLLTVKKEVNQDQRDQISALIIHVIISDSRWTPILNEQSSRDRNSYLTYLRTTSNLYLFE